MFLLKWSYVLDRTDSDCRNRWGTVIWNYYSNSKEASTACVNWMGQMPIWHIYNDVYLLLNMGCCFLHCDIGIDFWKKKLRWKMKKWVPLLLIFRYKLFCITCKLNKWNIGIIRFWAKVSQESIFDPWGVFIHHWSENFHNFFFLKYLMDLELYRPMLRKFSYL